MALHLPSSRKMAASVCSLWGILRSKHYLACNKLLLRDDSYHYLHRHLYLFRKHNSQFCECINSRNTLTTCRHVRPLQILQQPRAMTSGIDYVFWKSGIICPLKTTFAGEWKTTLCKRQISNNQSSFSFDGICEETLESLANYFEDLIGIHLSVDDTDVTLSDGVLTVNLGVHNGIYVINKQGPNKQIWLSSPISGPKRYDFVENQWIYKRDGITLHQLLTKEIGKALNTNVDFTQCNYGK